MPDAPPPSSSPLPSPYQASPPSFDPRFAPSAPLPTARPRRWLGIVTLLLLAAVVVLQRPESADPKGVEETRRAATVKPPKTDPYILLGKMLVGLRDTSPELKQLLPELVRSQLDAPAFGTPSPEDQVRVAMLLIATASTKPAAGEGGGAAAPQSPFPFPTANPDKPPRTLDRVLDDVEKNLAAESPLHDDIVIMRSLLKVADKDGATEQDIKAAVDGLSDQTKTDLRARHGWFAEVLLSTGDNTAPVRAAAATQSTLFVILTMLVGGIVLSAFAAGVVLLIVAIVKRGQGKIRSSFAPPQRADSDSSSDPRAAWARGLWLETLAVFLLGFLSLKLVQMALPHASWTVSVGLACQWALLACIFWPVIRGLSFGEWKAQMGWHAPRGVLREIGAGICGYLAGLPIFFAVAMLVAVLIIITEAIKHAITGGPPSEPPSNRITEIIGSGSPALLVVFFMLATIWAPIVEESIFRGALFRHLRGRFGFIGAAGFSAAAFALMHGYMFLQLLIIFTLGFMFAAMREWRNSVIPSATAHFIHNSFVMSVLLMAGWFMRG